MTCRKRRFAKGLPRWLPSEACLVVMLFSQGRLNRSAVLWRAGLSERRTAALGCAAVAKPDLSVYLMHRVAGFGGASRPSAGKPARHKSRPDLRQRLTGVVGSLRGF